ncbi:hypothetical protein [Phycicoccus sonneratiae]|uniref:Uncharacterized protein n=1 Tax=Phycicoccus sonneratiae TaxID=2807628 RepID=A0ABS2CQB7_9MICO|nr:hypothetical protein [Phycicoccus sonneraticus]MBM6402064.1 hypothetical protein [Phycicoccus sonneraticus]
MNTPMAASTTPRRSIRFEAAPPTRPRHPDGERRTTLAVVVDVVEGRGAAEAERVVAGRVDPRPDARADDALAEPFADPEADDGRAADPRRGGRDAGPVLRLEAIGCSPGCLRLRPDRR